MSLCDHISTGVEENFSLQGHGPKLAVVGAIHAVDPLGDVVGQQLVDPALKTRIVCASRRDAFQSQSLVSPKEFVAAGLLPEADDSPADAGCNVDLQMF